MRYPNNFAFGRFNWPMDIWVPEQNTFLTLYYSPHFIASLTLILLIFLLTTMFAARQKISYAIYAGLAGLLLFFFHPFHVLTVFCVILVYFAVLVFKDKKYFWPLVKYYFIFFILSLPAIVYYLYLLNFDFVVKQKSLQNICPTTSLWLTLFSYGLLLVFSVVGFFKLAGKTKKFYLMDNNFLFILVWAAVGLILIYSPVAYQRRLTQGLHFPFVVLTTVGLFFCYEALLTKKNNLLKHLFKQRYTILFLLSVLFIGSNVFNLAIDLSIYRDRRAISYLNNNLVQAMEWLKSTSPDSIIFNSADNQVNVVPAYSGRTVYVGHGVETVDFFEKQKEVDWFFANNRPAESERNFLLERGVDYIFYSGLEKKLGSYNPDTKEYLKNVYSNGSASIYKVL